jgi:hypothetical protein
VRFRDLLLNVSKPPDKDDKAGDALGDAAKASGKLARVRTGAKLKLVASYLEQHPLQPLDVATLLMIAAGLAIRQRDPLRMILIASRVKACYGIHPHAREIDEALDELISNT